MSLWLKRVAYRCLQRVMVLERVTVMIAETSKLAAESINGQAERISAAKLKRFIESGEAPYCEELVERLDDPRLSCFAVIAAERLSSFAWFFHGSAEAGMNYGRSKATATAIELDECSVFVFHAYTAAGSRGVGLMREVLCCAANELAESGGADWLVATTESLNTQARRAFGRTGFQEIGHYTRYGIGSRVFGSYPKPVPPIQSFG